jgi:hypothetical protein
MEVPPAEPDEPEVPQWSVILDAPDYLKLLKKPATVTSREYEQKVLSVLKEILKYRLTPTGLPDAAAILTWGPDFASRAGALADHDERAAHAIDLLTAPDSPWVMFALVCIPFVSQLFRNHEEQVKLIPGNMRRTRAERKAAKATQPRAEFSIPGTKRRVRVPFRIRVPFRMFRASTQEPSILVHQTIGNPDIQKALYKSFGVTFGNNNANSPQ